MKCVSLCLEVQSWKKLKVWIKAQQQHAEVWEEQYKNFESIEIVHGLIIKVASQDKIYLSLINRWKNNAKQED